MKCFECKQKVSTASMVNYLAEDLSGEASRTVCHDCYVRLTFDGCHYVVVKSLKSSKPSIKS